MFLVSKNACHGGNPAPLETPLQGSRMTDTKPQIGRPRLAEGEQRDERLPPVRVTAAELAFVQEQAVRAGLSLSEYCRRIVLRRKVAAARSGADDALLLELNRVGVNLNQIAHRLNAGGKTPPHLAVVLDEVRAAVTRLADDGS